MRSVETTFRVLDAVVQHQPIGVSDLARALELPKSTVQRALGDLAGGGWIEAWTGGTSTRWVIGPRPGEIAKSASGSTVLLVDAARESMQQLGRETDETIHLTVPDGERMRLVSKVSSRQAVTTVSHVGGQVPMYASASGLAILTHRTDWSYLVSELKQLTDTTLVTADDLEHALVRAREVGYTVNRGMWRDGVSAVGAAICDPEGQPVGALTISVPTYRLPEELEAPYGKLVSAACVEVARRRFGAS